MPQVDATLHERFTSWMAEVEKPYPGPDSIDSLALFSGMRMTIDTPTVQFRRIAVRESLDACPVTCSGRDAVESRRGLVAAEDKASRRMYPFTQGRNKGDVVELLNSNLKRRGKP
jgi:hypothetical protein